MITARPATRDLAARLARRAEALAKRRAHEIAGETSAAHWRDPSALWPDFGMDQTHGK